MKVKIFTIILVCFASMAYSQIPKDYYKSAEGLKGTELKTALHKIIRGHKQYFYTKGKPNVWEILKESDRDTVNPDNIILIYTGKSINANDNYHAKNWNREHVWAKSHGNFGTAIGTGTDVHAIRPCTPKVNSARSNYDFAEGGEPYILDGEDTGCKFTSNSWEPRDAVKGDIARMIFYMATRYEGNYEENGETINELDLELIDYVGSYSKKQPVHGKLSDLLKWHKQDPVDSMEIRRNEVVFKYQKNRNPFIDHPEFVNLIYGNSSSTGIKQFTNIYIVKAYPNPAKSFIIVELNDNIGENDKFQVQIFDMNGKQQLNIGINSNMNLINCNNLNKGMYVLKVVDDKKVVSTQKIVIE